MSREEDGVPRIKLMRDAVARASRVLGPEDWVSVVKIPEEGQPVLPLVKLGDGSRFVQALERLQPRGSTRVVDALEAAELVLREVKTQVKHILLVTDAETSEEAEAIRAMGLRLKESSLKGTLVLTSESRKLASLDWPTVTSTDLNQLAESLELPLKLASGLFVDGIATKAEDQNWLTNGVPPFMLQRINRTTEKDASSLMLRTTDGLPVGAFRPSRTGGCVALTFGTDVSWVDSTQWESAARVIRNAVEQLSANREARLRIQALPGEEGMLLRVIAAGGKVPEAIGSIHPTVKHLRSGKRTAGKLGRISRDAFEGVLPDLGPGTYLVDVPELKGRGYGTRMYGRELEGIGVSGERLKKLGRLGWEILPDFSGFAARPVSKAARVRRSLRGTFIVLALVVMIGQLLLGALWKR
jgi:hypothetical protein